MQSSRPEENFLIETLRALMGPSPIPVNFPENSGLDWDYLHQIAQTHGVTALLYCALVKGDRGKIPHGFLAPLQKSFEENARRNLRLTQELLEILNLLESQEVLAIPFKGPLLALAVYGNLAMRQSVDLDILVRRQDVLKAKGILTGAGYAALYSMTGIQEAVFLDLDCEYYLTHPEERAAVELHWGFVPKYFPFDFDFGSLWVREDAMTLSGKTIKTISSEDLILLLCVHGTKHGWNRLQWIFDIAKLLNLRGKIQWDIVLNRASRAGCRRMLYLGLWLGHEVGGARLPEDIRDKIQADRKVLDFSERIRKNLFLESYARPGMSRESHWFCMRIRERCLDRLRYVLGLLFLPTFADLTSVRFPRFLGFLYYVMRPFRLAFRQTSAFFKPGALHRTRPAASGKILLL